MRSVRDRRGGGQLKLETTIRWLARVLALLGGVVLVTITVMTCVSILGRAVVTLAHTRDPAFFDWLVGAAQWLAALGVRPVSGDFELVEAGTGFAVFAFLPWCQLNRGHATVDLFTAQLPAAPNRVIDFIAELLMTVVLVVITWRLYAGMMDKIAYGEVTFILQFPQWWGFAPCVVAAAIACVVSAWLTVVRFRELIEGRTILGPGQGVQH